MPASPDDDRPLIQVLQDSTDVGSASWPIRLDHVIAVLRNLEVQHRANGEHGIADEMQCAAGKLASAQLDQRYWPRMVRYWATRAVEAEDKLAALTHSARAEASA